MSYNIDNIDVVALNASITLEDLETISKTLKGWPESNFVDEHLEEVKSGALQAVDGRVVLDSFSWSGEGSGRAYHDHMRNIAAKICGTIEAVLFWEGGDSVTGLRITGGVMTEPKVSITLADD